MRTPPEDFQPEVLNKRDFGHGLPPFSVYCGRGSPFGNPYRIGLHGSRDEVIARYIAERQDDPEFIALVRKRLRRRHLVCHCKPLSCHCDWLIQIANTDATVL